MPFSLVPIGLGEPYNVTLPMTIVGAKDGCDFRIEGESVAALCCVLALTDGLLLFRDLDTDSIHVDGMCVRRAVLLPNSRLTIASRQFLVQYKP